MQHRLKPRDIAAKVFPIDFLHDIQQPAPQDWVVGCTVSAVAAFVCGRIVTGGSDNAEFCGNLLRFLGFIVSRLLRWRRRFPRFVIVRAVEEEIQHCVDSLRCLFRRGQIIVASDTDALTNFMYLLSLDIFESAMNFSEIGDM